MKLNPKLKQKLILGYCTLATMDILDIMGKVFFMEFNCAASENQLLGVCKLGNPRHWDSGISECLGEASGALVVAAASLGLMPPPSLDACRS